MKRNILLSIIFLVITGNQFAQNVGITDGATFTPNYLLHLHHNAASGTVFQLTNTTSGTATTDGFLIKLEAGFKVSFINQENAAMSFYTYNTERLIIDNAGNTGIGTSTPWAILNVYSNSKGVVFTRLTTSQQLSISSPVAGMLVYNTDLHCYYFYEGSKWLSLCTGACLAPSTPGTITGNASPCASSAGNIYSIISVGATTYTWAPPTGASITGGQGTTSVTITFGTNSGDLCVTAGNSCGTSSSSCKTISLITPPAQPSVISLVSGSVKWCTGDENTYSVVDAGYTYTWSANNDAYITSGQGTNQVTVYFSGESGSVIISVVASNGCGSSPVRTRTVLYNAIGC